MAARKRTLDRRALRVDEDEEVLDEELDEDEDDEAEEADEEAGDSDGDDEEEAPVAKPKKKPAKKKTTTPRKPKAQKIVRRRAVWVIKDNSNKPVERFAYNQKQEAEEALEKRNAEKKTGHFLELIKEEIEE